MSSNHILEQEIFVALKELAYEALADSRSVQTWLILHFDKFAQTQLVPENVNSWLIIIGSRIIDYANLYTSTQHLGLS